MRISVLITVHNRKEQTLKCLKNLYSQSLPDDFQLDVYLTDDGCTDGTPEAIKRDYPKVIIISGNGNLFWNRGMYMAWSEAEKNDYDYYLWLNDDTYLLDDCIKMLLNASDKANNKAIIVGYTLDSNRQKVTYGGTDRYNRIILAHDSLTECDTFNGNIVLIPRYVYKIVGKNDPIFHHAIGDTDYGLRAKKLGIKSYIVAEPLGICDLHEHIAKWKDPGVPLIKRIRFLYKPGGNGSNPKQFFIYKMRHFGIMQAVITFISNHLHVLFPSLWKKS